MTDTNQDIKMKRDEAIRRALEMPHRPLKKKEDAANSGAKKVKVSTNKSTRQAPEKA